MGSILSILRNTHYFHRVDIVYTKRYGIYSWVDTADTQQKVAFSGLGFLLLSTKKKFWGIVTTYTTQYAALSRDRRLHTNKYAQFLGGVDASFTMQYEVFS